MLTSEQHLAAETIAKCYKVLAKRQSNIVLDLTKTAVELVQRQHYPKKSIQSTNTQYYYHCHDRKNATDNNVHEHGHFHFFFRNPQNFTSAHPLVVSENHLFDPTKDNLSHLLAIAVNEYAQPTAIFTTNHWVTQGLWYSADSMCKLLEFLDFENVKSFVTVNRWAGAMFKLFKPQIIELFYHRDQVIAEWQKEYPEQNVFKNHQLEITSIFSFI